MYFISWENKRFRIGGNFEVGRYFKTKGEAMKYLTSTNIARMKRKFGHPAFDKGATIKIKKW